MTGLKPLNCRMHVQLSPEAILLCVCRLFVTIAVALLAVLPVAAQDIGEFKDPPSFCYPPPCDIPECDSIDTADYVVPSYSGWQTARRIWTQKGGGQYPVGMRFYASGKLRRDSWKTGTLTVDANGIWITSEQPVNNTGLLRLFGSPGATWMPRVAYSNCLNWFQACWTETWYTKYPGCGFDHANPRHCAIHYSYIEHLSSYNFGGQVGSMEAIVKVDKNDDGAVEKYYYGLHRGFLRWEFYNPSGVLTNWSKQVDEIPNLPYTRDACFLP